MNPLDISIRPSRVANSDRKPWLMSYNEYTVYLNGKQVGKICETRRDAWHFVQGLEEGIRWARENS